MSSKAKLLIKGSIIRTVYFFISVLSGLFLMPLMIRSFGDELYGLWMLIFSLVGFYLLFDLGLGSATQRYVSRAVGKEDHKEANAIANTSFLLFSIIGAIVLLISIASAYLLPLAVKNITNIRLFRILMIILGANLALSIPMKVFSGILTSHLRIDMQTGVELFKVILRTVLIVLALNLRHGVITVALIFCFIDLLGYLISYLLVKKEAPYITFSFRFFDSTKIKELYSYSWKIFVAQIGDKLRFNIDNFVIVGFLGLNFVTIFSIASRLTFHFMNLTTSAVGMLSPVFSQFEGRGDFHSIREKFILTTKISSYLTIFIGGSIIILGKAFIERWMGSQYLDAYPLLVVLTICMASDLIQNPSVQLLYGISKHNFYAIINIIEGITNLIISLLLVKKLGLMGIALGTAIPMLIIKLFIQPFYVCRIVGISIFKYYTDILGLVLIKSLTLMLIFYLISYRFICPNYFSILSVSIIGLIIFSTAIFYIGFSKNERNYFKRIANSHT